MKADTRMDQGADDRAGSRGLEELLARLLARHEELAAATAAQREAVRRADPAAIAATREAMAAACEQIAALDLERAALVRALAPEQPEATLTYVASGLAEPARSRALEIAGRLRELAIRTRIEERRLRAATDSMLRHVRGLVHHVQRSLNHAGIYGRGGRVEPGAAVVSGIDLTR